MNFAKDNVGIFGGMIVVRNK